MELDELEIGDARAGQVRERDAVAGRHGGIRRLAIDLARAAGGQQRGARARLGRARRRRSRNRTPATRAVLDDGLHRHGVIETSTDREADEPRGQHAADLAAGRVVRVQHAPDRVRAFAREVERAVRRAIERRAPLDQLVERSAALPTRARARPLVAQPVAGARSCPRRGVRASRRRRRRRRCRPARSRCCRRRDRTW